MIGYGGTDLPVDDTKRIAVDLTDGVGAFNATGSTTLSVDLSVNAATTDNGTITSADFYEDIAGTGTPHHYASTDPTVTVTPGTTGSATVSISMPPGFDYQVIGVDLPSLLCWGQSFPADVTVRNMGSASWLTSAVSLQSLDPVSRWGLPALPVSSSTPTLGENDFTFNVTAPPVTTLVYTTPYSQTTPAVADSLPIGFQLVRSATPLTGATMTGAVTISHFPDDQTDSPGAWARTQIEECSGRVPQIVSGYGDGTYGPRIVITRDQMAVFMQRSLMLPLQAYQGTFSDITSDFWAAQQIEALARANIVSGYSGGTYQATNVVTRDMMAVFVARGLAGSDAAVPAGPTTSPFPDVATNFWAYKHIAYCVSQHVVSGYGDGNYHPEYSVTRDQMAVFVYRAFIQSRPCAVVLAGPAVTSEDLSVGTETGWTATPTASVATSR